MTRIGDWLRSPDARWLLAVFALALVIRLLFIAEVRPNPRDGRFDDSVFYDSAAQHMAAGDGYVFDPTIWTAINGNPIYPDLHQPEPTALWPPGYPIVLAGIYRVTNNSIEAGRVANVIFGALTVVLVYLIGRRLFDRAAAICAAVALALLPAHIMFTTILMSETMFGFMLALVLAVCVYFVFGRDRPSLPAIAATGTLTALTGLVRGEFLFFGGIIALLMLYQWRSRAFVPLIMLAAGAVLVITPWAIRNRITMGETIIGTTGSGRVMFQGHNEKTDGGPSLEAVFRLEQYILERHPGIGLKDMEIYSMRDGARLAREYALDHKLKEIDLIGRRMWLLFRSDEAGVTWLHSNRPWWGPETADKLITASTASFWLLIALTVVSAPVWWRGDAKRLVVFALIPFYMLVFGVLFIGDPRYHYAMYVPLAIFGGCGAAALGRVTTAQWREVIDQRPSGPALRAYGTPER